MRGARFLTTLSAVSSPTGILLVNLGTPDAPDATAVRRYLAEFLSDPRVLDIHPVARWMLLHLIILRTRPAKSAAAYQKVWSREGSPLLVLSQQLRDKVAARLESDDVKVELAMRYGNPSLASGIAKLRDAGCDSLIVFPLYPQYAASSTGSTVEEVNRLASAAWNTPFITVVPPFYEDPRFLDAFAAVGRPQMETFKPDHVLMSFHGLPERHIRKSEDGSGHCLVKDDCCAAIGPHNRNCYRAQCFATARGLAARLGLSEDGYTVSFQSRLGRTPWISPYTDVLLDEFPKQGKKRLAVFCPAFVADCLETLEEIGMAAKEQFEGDSDRKLELVPSLNAEPAWVDAVVSILEDHLSAGRPRADETSTPAAQASAGIGT